jgi:hypothetical protein
MRSGQDRNRQRSDAPSLFIHQPWASDPFIRRSDGWSTMDAVHIAALITVVLAGVDGWRRILCSGVRASSQSSPVGVPVRASQTCMTLRLRSRNGSLFSVRNRVAPNLGSAIPGSEDRLSGQRVYAGASRRRPPVDTCRTREARYRSDQSSRPPWLRSARSPACTRDLE